jgi:predicted RNA-binding Zn-ribbon protein involved in translation (DUF1610 family)
MTLTFPCQACGAPVEPAANLERMPCPFCGTQLTIPEALQTRKPVAPPPQPAQFDPFESARRATRANTPVPDTFTPKLVNALNSLDPVARRAYSTYAWGSMARRRLPGCLALLAVACLLACAMGVGFAYLLGRLPGLLR